MFGLISKLRAHTGQRDALIAALMQGSRAMPGCIHYIVSKDVHEEHTLWVVETWDSSQAHHSAQALPEVVGALAKGKPLIAAVERRVEMVPVSAASCS